MARAKVDKLQPGSTKIDRLKDPFDLLYFGMQTLCLTYTDQFQDDCNLPGNWSELCCVKWLAF